MVDTHDPWYSDIIGIINIIEIIPSPINHLNFHHSLYYIVEIGQPELRGPITLVPTRGELDEGGRALRLPEGNLPVHHGGMVGYLPAHHYIF